MFILNTYFNLSCTFLACEGKGAGSSAGKNGSVLEKQGSAQA